MRRWACGRRAAAPLFSPAGAPRGPPSAPAGAGVLPLPRAPPWALLSNRTPLPPGVKQHTACGDTHVCYMKPTASARAERNNCVRGLHVVKLDYLYADLLVPDVFLEASMCKPERGSRISGAVEDRADCRANFPVQKVLP